MKTYFQKLLQWSILGLWFLATILVWFYLVNAWTSNYAGLESQTWDKMTSSKLNSIVKRSTRIDVSTSDTAPFDTGCERRYYDINMKYFSIITTYGIFLAFQEWWTTYQRAGIKSTEKWTIYEADGSLNFSSNIIRSWTLIQKKCQN